MLQARLEIDTRSFESRIYYFSIRYLPQLPNSSSHLHFVIHSLQSSSQEIERIITASFMPTSKYSNVVRE